MKGSTWLGPRTQAMDGATARLVAVPCAGASHAFYSSWVRDAPSCLEVRPVRMPGRGGPRVELAGVREFGEAIAQEITDEDDPRPVAVFGHSFGGLVAYETARCLRQRAGHPPALLVISGVAAAPPADGGLDAGQASDAELLAYLRDMGGTPKEILADPDFTDFLLAQLRRDLALFRGARHTDLIRLGIPIWAVAGSQDAAADAPAMRAWLSFGSDRSSVISYPGGHFAINASEARRDLLARITETVLTSTTASHIPR
ncbi:alpha/beta fold hydrolase [Nonomuraea sp. NPDC049152]|uniref:thioesterase II family protein n=1 Tax=Nonomuraea sp. NPDC049152 TaxID=3154350 RepID=UPI0033FED327